jgi:hypothetical protein
MVRMVRRLAHLPLAASLTLASLALVPSVAAAADATMGQDEVTLKDGGTLRGTVVSSQPGVGVKIIELGQSSARMIPWAQIGDVERGKFAPPKAGRAQPGSAGPGYGQAVPVPAAPSPTNGREVRLHVDSPKPALVYSHETAYGAVNGYGFVIDAATPVCSSPCDKVLDGGSGQTYTAAGDFNPSPPFTLAGRQGDVELSVEPGSHGVRVLGYVLVFVGGLAVITGGSFALAGAVLPSTSTNYNDDGTTSTTDSGTGWMAPTGLAIAGGGVAMIVGGIIALVESKTKIDLHPMGAGGSHSGASTAVAPRYWMGEF